jgi:hypothetical protein
MLKVKVKDEDGGVSIRFLDAIEDTGVCEVQQGDGVSHVLVGMHDDTQAAIDRDTMRELLPFLQRFVDTGSIQEQGEPK